MIKTKAIKDELEDYKGKWANLYVYSSGSGLGFGTFSSKEEAKRCVGISTDGRPINENDICVISSGKFKESELLFTMQIPVKEQ